MTEEPERSSAAREAAELALVRVVHHYGGKPSFELLADRDDRPQGATIHFDDCEHLGAANLRGTGFATRDVTERTISAKHAGVQRTVRVDVTGLAGFLMAKTAAAHSRHKSKDWYDIAYVLIHNDEHVAGEDAVKAAFGSVLPESKSALIDLRANFEEPGHPGPVAYADQVLLDHPDQDESQLRADAVLFVTRFCDTLLQSG